MALTERAILRAAAELAAERGLDFAPEGFVDVDGLCVSPVEFASMVAARLASEPPPAASEDAPPVRTPTGVRVLNRIVQARRSMMTRLLAAAEHAYEEALRLAGVKLIARARGRSGKQRLAAVCAAVEQHYPLEPWLGVVGVTEMEMLDHAFDTFRARATRELERYRDRVIALASGAGLDVPERRFNIDEAVRGLVHGLTAMTRARLLHGDEAMQSAVPGEIRVKIPRRRTDLPDIPKARRVKPPEGFDPGFVGRVDTDELSRAAASLVRKATNVAEGNGTFRLPTTGDGMPDVVVSRTEPDLMEELATEFTVSPIWTWVHGFYGEPLHDFEPHAIDLDGLETTDRDTDPALLNPDTFPPGDYYFPGDHDGCTCEWVPMEGESEQPLSTPRIQSTQAVREAARARLEQG